jgi:5-bromo-4-chloroindolyl phosphate hydrolysis protein
MATERTEQDVQALKGGRNQALFREVNERIAALAETAGSMEFVCECANVDCIETFEMSLAEYERIRSSPTRFPIAAGHEYLEFESVVEICDRYAVVQKKGTAAEESLRLDPRSA